MLLRTGLRRVTRGLPGACCRHHHHHRQQQPLTISSAQAAAAVGQPRSSGVAAGSTRRGHSSTTMAAAASSGAAAGDTTSSNSSSTVVFDGAALKRTIRGVVFDMDGTLTVPVIDFQYMRQRAGVGPTGDILDIISSWPADKQAAAHAAIAEVEEQALQDMQAMPGLLQLCAYLDSRGLPRGLITRNVLRSVAFFHEHHLPLPPFVPAISRECQFPYKPSPVALQHICESWGIQPCEVIMVGDSAKDDVVSGNRAGAVTVLLDSEGRYAQPEGAAMLLQGECRPSVMVPSLASFHELLQHTFHLAPPLGAGDASVEAGAGADGR